MFTHRVVFDQEYDPHTNRHRFPENFSKIEPNAERLVKFFCDVRVYLLVDESVTIVYIRV